MLSVRNMNNTIQMDRQEKVHYRYILYKETKLEIARKSFNC